MAVKGTLKSNGNEILIKQSQIENLDTTLESYLKQEGGMAKSLSADEISVQTRVSAASFSANAYCTSSGTAGAMITSGETNSTLVYVKKSSDAGSNDYEIATKKDIADLVDSAPETLNTLGELATALQENDSVVDALNSAIGNKANSDTVNLISNSVDALNTNVDNILNGTVAVPVSTKATQDGNGKTISDTYATKEELEENYATKQELENIDLTNVHAVTAQTATKAIQDGNGNVITTTYATKEELTNAELGTGSTPADEIYLRLDGGNQVSNDINFKYTSSGLKLNNSQHAIGFNDVGEPTFVNSLGRYFCLGTDDLDGNYIYYYLPEGKDSFNIATKEKIEDGDIIPYAVNVATYIAVQDDSGQSHFDITFSDILELDDYSSPTGKVLKAKEADSAKNLEVQTISTTGAAVDSIYISTKGLYSVTLEAYTEAGHATGTYFNIMLSIIDLTKNIQTTFIPYHENDYAEYCSLNYVSTGEDLEMGDITIGSYYCDPSKGKTYGSFKIIDCKKIISY